jgi:hypothetical protein
MYFARLRHRPECGSTYFISIKNLNNRLSRGINPSQCQWILPRIINSRDLSWMAPKEEKGAGYNVSRCAGGNVIEATILRAIMSEYNKKKPPT